MDASAIAEQIQQRRYYAQTAEQYDSLHVNDMDEHAFALAFMLGMVRLYGFSSVLDVGTGTGRALLKLKEREPTVQGAGVEPSQELREIAHSKGLADVRPGNALNLEFEDNSFDLVCAFGVMHHLPYPAKAAREMARVAKRAIFISDHNDVARGSPLTRTLKRAIKDFGLWSVYDFIVTRGKGYRNTDDDGLWYSYSIVDTAQQIKSMGFDIHILNTTPSSTHLAVFGYKNDTRSSMASLGRLAHRNPD